jgi:SPP1 gp7 family putative phage head morphogenesis protein
MLFVRRPHVVKFVANAVSRVDPTRTITIRKKFARAMRVRFARLKKEIHIVIITENGFGLITNKVGKFDFTRTADKHGAFMDWLRAADERHILSIRHGTPFRTAASTSWMNTYIDTAYQRGVAQAAGNLIKEGATISNRFIDASFGRPIHADAVALLYTRTYNDLVGITDAMDKAISRTLAEGFANGDGMIDIARAIAENVDGIGRARAEVLARTEVISAHAEGSLNLYQEAGIEGVAVDAEFATAEDDAVCPECEGMQGDVMSIEEARGIIPLHPNCRCAWLPIVNDPTGIELQ